MKWVSEEEQDWLYEMIVASPTNFVHVHLLEYRFQNFDSISAILSVQVGLQILLRNEEIQDTNTRTAQDKAEKVNLTGFRRRN